MSTAGLDLESTIDRGNRLVARRTSRDVLYHAWPKSARRHGPHSDSACLLGVASRTSPLALPRFGKLQLAAVRSRPWQTRADQGRLEHDRDNQGFECDAGP